MENWDPLELQDTATTEIVAAARKREIRNILKSYVGFFDPFCELIQNALDAVDLREQTLKEKDYKKEIWIDIDIKNNTLTVTDNGIGFSEAQFRTFLSPSISFKNAKNSRGNKGVGATYLAYGFNNLMLGTKTPDFVSYSQIQNGREWLDDEETVVARPIVKPGPNYNERLRNVDRGSTFSLRFSGNVRPKSLTWISADTAEQWRVLLLVKTPLGQILKSSQFPSATFNLTVTDEGGNITSVENQPCIYIFPHTVIKASAKIGDINDVQSKLLSQGKDVSKLPAKFKRLNAVFDWWDSDDLLNLQFSEEEKNLIKLHEVWVYGFFCYSAIHVFDKYNDDTARLRKGQRVIRGGLQLATNLMPQGELITIPLTSNIGYQNQAHVIVHLNNAEPDLGRKGFQPELQKLGERISVSIVNRLRDCFLKAFSPLSTRRTRRKPLKNLCGLCGLRGQSS